MSTRTLWGTPGTMRRTMGNLLPNKHSGGKVPVVIIC